MAPFELEQLHVLLVSIGGIQNCVFYEQVNDKSKLFKVVT